MLRYSLAGLATVLVGAAIYSAALAQGDGLWPQISVTLTVAILLFATLAAVFSRTSSRTFAMGFSIVGWLYFLMVFPGIAGGVRENLLTQTAIDWLYGQVHAPDTQGAYRILPYTSSGPQPVPLYSIPPVTTVTGVQQTIAFAPQPSPPTPGGQVSPYHFAQIGHSLWAVLIGAIAGVVAQVIHARSRRPQTNGESPQ